MPRYIKGAIDTTAYLDCRGVPPPAIETTPPTPKQSLEDTCDGKKKVLTKLDFYDATLTENTLHYPDQSGRLRYAGVGVVHGESIDLVVTQHPGSAPYSTDMSIRNGYNRGTLVSCFFLFRCCFDSNVHGRSCSVVTSILSLFLLFLLFHFMDRR